MAAVRLWVLRWSTRVQLALLLVAAAVLPIGAWAAKPHDGIGTVLNVCAALVIYGIVAVVAVRGIRATV